MSDPAAELLAKFRETYANRRTVPWELLSHAEDIVKTSAAYHAQLAKSTEDLLRKEIERLEKKADDWKDRYDRLLAQQTNLREDRESVADGTLIKIQAPRTVNKWSGNTEGYPRPWTLGEIDILQHRLRMAGAEDDVEVRFRHEHVEATVPYPEFALEPVKKAQTTDTSSKKRKRLDDSTKLAMYIMLASLTAGFEGLLLIFR